jgi:hypothetical protein
VGAEVTVGHRLGSLGIEFTAGTGVLLASHRRETPGMGLVVRDPAHRAALELQVLSAFTTDQPCNRKANRPPSKAAQQEAARLRGLDHDGAVVVDLDDYQRIVDSMGRHGESA